MSAGAKEPRRLIVALVEYPDEVAQLDHVVQDNVVEWIALRPEVQLYLKGNKRTFITSLQFLSRSDHEAIVTEVEQELQRWRDRIDFSGIGGKPNALRDAFLYYLRFCLAHAIALKRIIMRVSQKYSDAKLISVVRRANPIDGPYIQEGERYVGLLLEQFGKAHGVAYGLVELSNYSETNGNSNGFGAFFIDLIGSALVTLTMSLTMKKRSTTLLFASDSYGMDSVIGRLSQDNPNWVCGVVNESEGGGIRRILKQLIGVLRARSRPLFDLFFLSPIWESESSHIQLLERIQKSVPPVTAESVSFLFERKVQGGVFHELLKIYRGQLGLMKLVIFLNPSVIISQFSQGRHGSFGEIAVSADIPYLFFPHAIPVETSDPYIRSEFNSIWFPLQAGGIVAPGPPTYEYFLAEGIPDNCILKTGPLLWNRPKTSSHKNFFYEHGIPEGSHLVLQASTQRRRGVERYYISETLDEYIASTSDLIFAIQEIDCAYLLIKPHLGCGLSACELRQLLPDLTNYTVVTDLPLYRAMVHASVVVGSSYSAIFEAVYNSIPVVVYDPWKRIQQVEASAGSSLQVRYVTDPLFLKENVKESLASPDTGRHRKQCQDEFLYPVNSSSWESLNAWLAQAAKGER